MTQKTNWEEELNKFAYQKELKTIFCQLLSAEKQKWKEETQKEIEKIIQEDRYSGAPYALNKIKEIIKNL